MVKSENKKKQNNYCFAYRINFYSILCRNGFDFCFT